MINNKFITVTLLAISATLFGSFMGAGVKLLSDDLHPIIICFYRCLMGLIIITPFVARNNFRALQTDNMRLQIFRALINIISMICWFSAIGMMHFEKATALGFTTPLFTTVLAVLILGEVIRFHRLISKRFERCRNVVLNRFRYRFEYLAERFVLPIFHTIRDLLYLPWIIIDARQYGGRALEPVV